MSSHFRGIAALLFVTMIWGVTFPALKDLTAVMSPAWIMCIRFGIATLILSPLLIRATRAEIRAGALLGLVVFLSYLLQVEGIELTSADRNAFITGLNVLIVPVLGIFLGQFPTKRIVMACALSLLGLYIVCGVNEGGWNWGDTLTLAGAVFYALGVKMLEVYSRRFEHPPRFAAIQIAAILIFSIIYLLAKPGALWADLPAFEARFIPHMLNLLYLGILATALVLVVQAWAQRRTSANEAAIVYSLEPAFATLAAFIWLGEILHESQMIGATLMIVGMIVSQWTPRFKSTLSRPAGTAR